MAQAGQEKKGCVAPTFEQSQGRDCKPLRPEEPEKARKNKKDQRIARGGYTSFPNRGKIVRSGR